MKWFPTDFKKKEEIAMISFKDKIDPYAPCYCGSGKKYRFCCQNRTFDVSVGSSLTADEKRYEKAKQLHAKGYALMSEHKYEEAIEQFKRSLELRPDVPNPVNNLALCHFILGNVDEAMAVQRDYLKKNHFLPSFGLANLSMFLYFKDETAAAVNTLYIAASQDIVGRDAALKICEIFARLHHYKDLYDFIFSRPDVDEPDFAFFAGVAAVNVGDAGHAVEYLRRVPDHDPKIVIARDFLKHLKAGTRPQSLRGDWPIFPPGEFYITPYLKDKSDTNPILKTLWLVDFVEACINDPDYRKMNECLDKYTVLR